MHQAASNSSTHLELKAASCSDREPAQERSLAASIEAGRRAEGALLSASSGRPRPDVHTAAPPARSFVFFLPFGRLSATESFLVRTADLLPCTSPERRRLDFIRGMATLAPERGWSGWRRLSAWRSSRSYRTRRTLPQRTSPSVQERLPLHEKRNARQCLPTRGVPDRDC